MVTEGFPGGEKIELVIEAREELAGLRRTAASLERSARLARHLSISLGAVGAAAIVAFRDAIRVINNFETQVNRVQAAVNATERDITRLRQQALRLGRETAFTASQAAEAQFRLAQSGYDVNETLRLMPDVLNVAAAGLLSMEEAGRIVTNQVATFNLGIEEATRVADVLALTAASSKTSISELGTTFRYAAPAAAAVGVSIEETAAAIGILRDRGLVAEQAGTGLRFNILRLVRPVASAAAVFDELGMSQSRVAQQIEEGKLLEVFAEFGKAGLTLNQAGRMFDVRAAGAALILSSAAQEAIELRDALLGAEGSSKRMAETQMQGLPGALLRMTSAIESMKIAFGDAGLTDFVIGVANTVRSAVNWVSSLSDGWLQFILIAGGVITVLTAVGSAFLGLRSVIRTYQAIQASGRVALMEEEAARQRAKAAIDAETASIGRNTTERMKNAGVSSSHDIFTNRATMMNEVFGAPAGAAGWRWTYKRQMPFRGIKSGSKLTDAAIQRFKTIASTFDPSGKTTWQDIYYNSARTRGFKRGMTPTISYITKKGKVVNIPVFQKFATTKQRSGYKDKKGYWRMRTDTRTKYGPYDPMAFDFGDLGRKQFGPPIGKTGFITNQYGKRIYTGPDFSPYSGPEYSGLRVSPSGYWESLKGAPPPRWAPPGDKFEDIWSDGWRKSRRKFFGVPIWSQQKKAGYTRYYKWRENRLAKFSQGFRDRQVERFFGTEPKFLPKIDKSVRGDAIGRAAIAGQIARAAYDLRQGIEKQTKPIMDQIDQNMAAIDAGHASNLSKLDAFRKTKLASIKRLENAEIEAMEIDSELVRKRNRLIPSHLTTGKQGETAEQRQVREGRLSAFYEKDPRIKAVNNEIREEVKKIKDNYAKKKVDLEQEYNQAITKNNQVRRQRITAHVDPLGQRIWEIRDKSNNELKRLGERYDALLNPSNKAKHNISFNEMEELQKLQKKSIRERNKMRRIRGYVTDFANPKLYQIRLNQMKDRYASGRFTSRALELRAAHKMFMDIGGRGATQQVGSIERAEINRLARSMGDPNVFAQSMRNSGAVAAESWAKGFTRRAGARVKVMGSTIGGALGMGIGMAAGSVGGAMLGQALGGPIGQSIGGMIGAVVGPAIFAALVASGPIGWVIAGIVGITAAIITLTNSWDKLINTVKRWARAVPFLKNFVGDENTVKSANQVVQGFNQPLPVAPQSAVRMATGNNNQQTTIMQPGAITVNAGNANAEETAMIVDRKFREMRQAENLQTTQYFDNPYAA